MSHTGSARHEVIAVEEMTIFSCLDIIFEEFLFLSCRSLNTSASEIQAVILCSRCDSRKDNYYGECEQSPPRPTPCPENNENMYCSIVRETDFDGIQLLFARDCATSYLEEKCVVRNHTTNRLKTVCFRTCDTNGCNSEKLKPRGEANYVQASYIFTFIMAGISSFLEFDHYVNA